MFNWHFNLADNYQAENKNDYYRIDNMNFSLMKYKYKSTVPIGVHKYFFRNNTIVENWIAIDAIIYWRSA